MSDRTTPALTKIDELTPLLAHLPPGPETTRLAEEMAALRRAVSAFHMEGIRFRMYNVERLLKRDGDAYVAALSVFNELRQLLETAGFHTRSHTAP